MYVNKVRENFLCKSQLKGFSRLSPKGLNSLLAFVSVSILVKCKYFLTKFLLYAIILLTFLTYSLAAKIYYWKVIENEFTCGKGCAARDLLLLMKIVVPQVPPIREMLGSQELMKRSFFIILIISYHFFWKSSTDRSKDMGLSQIIIIKIWNF